ncbi:MFS general substrate transporter, partial [Aureobasidium melanogenum]
MSEHDKKHQPDPYTEERISPATTADLDASYEAYKSHEGSPIDPAEAKRVLRKIDMRIVPILFVVYLLQYLDKNSLNFAAAYGFQKGTHLHDQEYSWLGSIFYFGYLWAQFPSGWLLQKLPIAKFLGTTTIIWGIILITTPACTNFAGVATNRFLLGTFEAVVNPGFVLIMGMWWTAAEQPLRLEAYYCTNGIATMVGGLLGYAIGHITTGSLARWMYVFLIFGSVSILWGIVVLVFLPDIPSTAKFLTERERYVAVERVASNRQGVKNSHFKRYQLVQTLQDPKTWILFVMAVGAQVPNSALTSFTSIIVSSFGFDTLGTQYLQIPGGFIQFAALLGGGFICSHFPNSRCIVMITANCICIIGAAMLVGLPSSNKWGRLVALWLCYFQGLGFSMSLTMCTGTILFVGYCVGNIIGPQTFRDSEKPGYHSAYIAMLVGYVVKLGMVVVLYIYMYTANKKRDREAGNMSVEEERLAVEQGMQDQTELDNKGFRYTL